LKAELEVLYFRDDFRTLNSAVPTLKYVISNDMNETFREVLVLLKILITTSMTSSEAERDVLQHWKGLKTCLRSTMGEEKLNALTMINVDFNKKVIDIF